MIKIQQKHLTEIYNHAEKTYPEECCGLLLGEIDASNKIVIEVIPTENSWNPDIDFGEIDSAKIDSDLSSQPSKLNRFSIAPKVILEVQKNARNLGLNIIGVYHSHPNGIPFPSEFDRSIAWHQYSYLITSVSEGKAEEIKSWVLDENNQFQGENLSIL